MKSLTERQTREEFRRAVADAALSQVGVYESPKGSNRTPYGIWYGFNGVAWCAIFVSWVYAKAAKEVGCENPLAGLQSAKGFAHVTSSYRRAKAWGIVLAQGEPVMVGDILAWSNYRGPLAKWIGSPGHTGVVTAVRSDGSFDVTEGNTNGAFSRTGGMVKTHRHMMLDGKHGRLRAVYRPTRRFS